MPTTVGRSHSRNWRAGASQPSCTTGTIFIYTSVKIIQLNEYGGRDAPCEKSWKQGNPLSNTIKDTSTIMRNPLSDYVGRVTLV